MTAKYLRSGKWEDTPLEEIPDEDLKLLVKALSGVGHAFSAAEQRLLQDEYARRAPRFAEETAAREREAAIKRGEIRVEEPEEEPEPPPADEEPEEEETRSTSRRGRR